MDMRERVAKLVRRYEEPDCSLTALDVADSILALFAEERAALEENLRSHGYKRDIALARAEAAEAREAKLREALDSLLSAIEDWHGSQRGEYCDEMCDRLHMAMDKADDALAKDGK